MSNHLNITLIQSHLYWQNCTANLAMFEEKIWRIHQNTDLIILPEMFNSGFTMDVKKHAERMNMTTFRWMKQQAKQTKAVIIGSFIIQENNHYYNRLIWMEPSGEFETYDKRHLFRMADEHQHFSAGKKRLIKSWKGVKICPMICYDLRFPVWSRNTKALDFDLLIYVANWPKARISAWNTLLKARAIENLSYCVGVNRTGEDGNGICYSGHSAVIDPKGEVIFHQEETETIKTISLDLEYLKKYRNKFPAHQDADNFKVLE